MYVAILYFQGFNDRYGYEDWEANLRIFLVISP